MSSMNGSRGTTDEAVAGWTGPVGSERLVLRDPLYRMSDPITSALAARYIQRTGITGQQEREVLAALATFPGSTSRELARYAKLDRHTVARRLPTLSKKGIVSRGRMRACAISGHQAITWDLRP